MILEDKDFPRGLQHWKRPPGRPQVTWYEDSPKCRWVPQSHIDWSSQCGSESPTLEVAGCEWRYALLVVQARNDDDGSGDDGDGDDGDGDDILMLLLLSPITSLRL